MYSSYDLEIDLSFFFWRVEDVGKERNNAKGNVQSNAILIPFLFACQSLD